MAYNPYNDVNEIYKAGKAWQAEKKKNKKDEIQNRAKQYYNNLSSNGYADTADLLSKSNSEKREKIANKFKTFGKTATRPYLYTLGKKKGLSNSDIDSLISYDNITGDITFGGKNIGRPDVVVDGTSYWSDTKPLDNAFDEYVKKSGVSTPSGINNTAYNQLMSTAAGEEEKLRSEMYKDKTDITSKYSNIFDYANQDITNTDEYKSAFKNIMPEYQLKAGKEYQNELADGASSNSGNIDSFAEANARRQQTAMTAKGQQLAHQMGLEAVNARLGNVQNVLSNLGIYNEGVYTNIQNTINGDKDTAQRYFENEQTNKMNGNTVENDKTQRLATRASVTGRTPIEWTVQEDDVYRKYLDESGNFKPEYSGTDFQILINEAKKNGQSELAKKLSVVRTKKMLSDMNKWGQYFDKGDTAYIEPDKTEDAKEFDATMQYNYNLLNSEEKQNAANRQNAIDQINAQSNANIAQINAQSAANINQVKEQAKYKENTTSDENHTYSNGTIVGDKDGKPILTLSQAKEMYENGNSSAQVAYALNYYEENVGDGAGIGNSWGNFISYFSEADHDEDIKNFLTSYVKPYYDNGWEINEEVLENLIVGEEAKKSNSTKYNIDVEDVRKISNALGLDSSWVDKYKNRTWFNAKKGMKAK